VVEVEVRVDDDRDATHELVRERVRMPLLVVLVERQRRVDHPRIDEDEPVGMLDRVGEAGQAVTGEDDFARQVPADIVTAEHGRSIWRRRPTHTSCSSTERGSGDVVGRLASPCDALRSVA
jgi:hypothetical protein